MTFVHWLFWPNELHAKLDKIAYTLGEIMSTQSQLAADLASLQVQLAKAKGEIVGKIQALEDALANAGGTTPEVDAALADLRAAVQGQDDIVPDVP